MVSHQTCDLCDRVIPQHGQYVVRIEVFADPEVPPLSSQDLADADFEAEVQRLLEEMKHLSEDELMDQVYRKFEFRICRACQIRMLVNPLGKPRSAGVGKN